MCSSVKLESRIRPLKTQFEGKGEVKGYLFVLLGMTNRAFLYEVSSGEAKHYEIFRKVINKRFTCVSYPASKSFGVWAYTKMTLESAIKKFDELNSKN